MSLTVQSKQCR